MVRFYGPFLTDLAWNAGMWRAAAIAVPGSRTTELGPEDHMVDVPGGLADQAETLGLATTVATLRKMAEGRARKFTFGEVQELHEELHGRLRDELAARICFMIETGKAKFFAEPYLFNTEDVKVSDQFPSAIYDIEEAGKCLALDRSTACVFHLMRVMEVGLQRLAKDLGIPYAPSWESYINQINTRIALKHKKKGIKWKRDESYFKEIAGDLLTVKVAWRNPTMHIVRTYTPEEAEQIFAAVRTLMQRIAARGATL